MDCPPPEHKEYWVAMDDIGFVFARSNSLRRTKKLVDMELDKMIVIYTKCASIEDADSLGHFIMSKGYEGVQNDSYRYCRLMMESAFKENARHYRNYIFVGVNGYQLVVDTNKRAMRKKYSCKYIEKERVFRDLLSRNLHFFQRYSEK